MSNTVRLIIYIEQTLYNEIVKAWKTIKESISFDDFIAQLIHSGLELQKKGEQS